MLISHLNWSERTRETWRARGKVWGNLIRSQAVAKNSYARATVRQQWQGRSWLTGDGTNNQTLGSSDNRTWDQLHAETEWLGTHSSRKTEKAFNQKRKFWTQIGAHAQADSHLCWREDRGKGNQGAMLEKSVGNKKMAGSSIHAGITEREINLETKIKNLLRSWKKNPWEGTNCTDRCK
jgi:hypothetical protein